MNDKVRKAFWANFNNQKRHEVGRLTGEREIVGFDHGAQIYGNVRILDKKESDEMRKSELKNRKIHFKDRYVKW